MPDIIWVGPDDELVEQANSPRWNFTDKITCTKVYRGKYALCVTSAPLRGTLGTGELAGYIAANSEVTPERGDIGILTTVWEGYAIEDGQSVAPALPPDEFGIDPFEINPSVAKNSAFSSLTDDQVKQVFNKFNERVSSTTTKVTDWNTAQKLLYDKLSRGNDSFYLAGLRYSWTRAYWSIAGTISLGGFRETPGGPLTDLFPTMVWLRQADDVKFTGQYYKYTVSWLGAPTGHWDTDLYGTS